MFQWRTYQYLDLMTTYYIINGLVRLSKVKDSNDLIDCPFIQIQIFFGRFMSRNIPK